MATWLKLAQLVVSIMLIISILLQSRGASLSGVFGGSNTVFRTKRGVEKILFTTTVILAIIFFALAFSLFVLVK
jgi:preprotein translocase subunit SecG